ncbi:putative component of RNA polymerase II holoenzyme [Coleophoma cylindrospora]|uniref:Mediator of RNA polymerase II transcription subunit 21 n=1 Tax=Coleophoma cylindrospora TaxID=1849047 RepID=A0A3D8S008_9HELO|nr:putative component of RNA polymerase II holoenzyme [Coleophoma cylindrospora]
MADKLTQLQDAVDQLAHQFVASLWYVHKHHDLKKLNEADKILEDKKENEIPDVDKLEPYPEADFKAGQLELARDLIVKEQQIEYLISVLPGLENSEKDQEQLIRQLEEELKEAEVRRQQAVKEKEVVLAKLESVIRSVKRP